MIKLFNNIENYRDLDLRDMSVVAWNFDFFVPPTYKKEFASQAEPLINKTKEITLKYFSAFTGERKEMGDLIEKYFDKDFFESRKEELKDKMFDTNHKLKDYFNQMTKEQLIDFGVVMCIWYVRFYLFMTHYNWMEFLQDLGTLAFSRNVHGFHEEQMEALSKEELEELFLKYIDINVILAEKAAEVLINGGIREDSFEKVEELISARCKNFYKTDNLI